MVILRFWKNFTFLVQKLCLLFFASVFANFWKHYLLSNPTNAYSPHGLFPTVQHEAGSVACEDVSVSRCISINLLIIMTSFI